MSLRRAGNDLGGACALAASTIACRLNASGCARCSGICSKRKPAKAQLYLAHAPTPALKPLCDEVSWELLMHLTSHKLLLQPRELAITAV
eukprot:Skav223283  [mRNA]  locus=scaffold2998:54357:57635:- [translate_table: standard]